MNEPVDALAPRRVTTSDVVHAGIVWDVVSDAVVLGEQGTVAREYIRHPGAVGIVALDDEGRVLLVRQYRHPVGHELWEPPAGLLDVEGEQPLEAARRELAEEADCRAGRWDVLADFFNSPGSSSEAIRVFLARDVSPVPEAELHQREHEEAGMPTRWFDLDDVRDAVLAGRVHNPTLVVGVLAACAAREVGWTTLRPADAPWPEHPAYR